MARRNTLPLLLALAILAGCGAPDPGETLRSALAATAAAPHTIKGRATRTVGTTVVSWDVTGAYAAPYAYVELDAKGMKRKTYGMQGWWVEQWTGVWRAYPPPHEAIEWLEPREFGAAVAGPDQTVNGVACRRVEAAYAAGKMHFDVSRKDGRIVHVQGVTFDQKDAYAFELWFDYSGGRVEPPAEAATVLGALAGRRPEGAEAEAKAAAEKAWESVVSGELSMSLLQVDYASGVEQRRTSGYMQQSPPLRAMERSVGMVRVFMMTDGRRTVASETLGGPIRETENMPPTLAEGVAKLIEGAAVLGEGEVRGVKCRLIGARLRGAGEGEGSAAAWLWVSGEGKLVRQVLVGKFTVPGDAPKEVTTYVDLVFEHGAPEGELIEAARRVFRK